MVAAAKDSLEKDWPKVKDYAQPELRRLAQSLIDITELVASDKVSGRQAQSLLRIHRNTSLTVLLTVEGIGIIAAEKAINAALKVVRDAVNAAAGLRII
jgi:Asp-tRNA(Asn)/Glu-tRNA(Gln) amidotransferase B subunit